MEEFFADLEPVSHWIPDKNPNCDHCASLAKKE
jgi:hypothetical protein